MGVRCPYPTLLFSFGVQRPRSGVNVRLHSDTSAARFVVPATRAIVQMIVVGVYRRHEIPSRNLLRIAEYQLP